MSWLCKKCETQNDDNDNICLVCNSIPPVLSSVSLDPRHSRISWNVENADEVTLKYSKGEFKVSDLTSTYIDISVVETLVFLAKSDVAERTFRFPLPYSFVQAALAFKEEEEIWKTALKSKSRKDAERYLSLYPDGIHIRAARNLLSKIEEQERRQKEADEAAWRLTVASNTESSFRYYISHFPSGDHVLEAKRLLNQILKEKDDKNWKRAQLLDSIEGYNEYILISENKTREKEARNRINRIVDENGWKKAISLDSIEGYTEYIHLYHLHLCEANEAIKRLREVEDKKKWEKACFINSLASYRAYLSEYPRGKFAGECRTRIEEKRWYEACRENTLHAFHQFYKDYPKSKYKDTALQRYIACQENDEWEKVKNTTSLSVLESFVKKYPSGLHVAEANAAIAKIKTINIEDSIWDSTRRSNTVESYEYYLSRYPNGRYVSIARQRIEELKPPFPVAFVIIIIAILIVFCLGIYSSCEKDYRSFDGGNSDIEQVNTKTDKKETPSTSVPISQPKKQSQISDSELRELENSTDRLIKGMELAIKLGDTRDEKTYRQVGKNLDELKKNGSNKYNSLKIRYDAL